MKSKIVLAVLLALAALLVAACEKKQEAATQPPPIVKGAQVGKVTLSAQNNYYEATGTVRSKTTTVLSSQVMGHIVALNVREGERVRAGQALIEIDNRDARAQAQRARAGLLEAHSAVEEVERNIHAAESAKTAAEAQRQLAEATFKRYQALLERRSVSPQEFDETQAKYRVAEAEVDRTDKMLRAVMARKNQVLARIEQAKAEVANAEVYVSHARITSPANGLVITRHAEVGALATPGAPLLTIEDNSRYRLEAAVEESLLGQIKLGARASVIVDALGPDELPGTVAEILPAADPASRSYTVKIDLPASGMLRSGLYGKARFALGQKEAITIPRQAIIERGQLVSVFVVDEAGLARLRLIKTGKVEDDQIEILSGLSAGERIVVGGVANVTDGSRVQ